MFLSGGAVGSVCVTTTIGGGVGVGTCAYVLRRPTSSNWLNTPPPPLPPPPPPPDEGAFGPPCPCPPPPRRELGGGTGTKMFGGGPPPGWPPTPASVRLFHCSTWPSPKRTLPEK